MDSKVDLGNGIAAETELPATVAVGTERALEAEAALKKEAEPVADHPTVTMISPAAETTIPEKLHSPMASNVHLGNGTAAGTPETETESEIPATAVEVAPEKELKPVGDLPTVTELTTAAETTVPRKKGRGWAEDCVIRVIVPVHKVESIIGRNGDIIKKMCQETKANIRVLEGPVWHPDRIVLISGKEEIEPPLSPAIDAVIRVFKCINGFPENESDGVPSDHCSIRLLVPLMQTMSLIEKQGCTTHKDAGFSVCIRYTWKRGKKCVKSHDRVVELQGKGLKVLQALEAVLEHLHMLLSDPNIPPLFKDIVTKRVPIARCKAGDILGVEGTNIANIGRTSGAVLTVHKSNNGIAVEIKGTPSQVKAARQLLDIQIKTVKDWARPAVLNKPTTQPQEGPALGFLPTDVDQALTRPPDLPQAQPPTALKAIETKSDVPAELPQVQPATAPEPIGTKAVMRASSDNSNVVEKAIQQMEAEEPVIPTPPEQAGPAFLDGMEHISEPKRIRVSWEDGNVVQTFLDACIHEIAINGREGGSLKAVSWKKVGEILKERHNFCVDHKQMKNYFDGLESRYRSWLMLKNKVENMYDLSLDDEMKKNKHIETLRDASPTFPDLCAQLFDSDTDTFTGIKSPGLSFAKQTPETNNQKGTMYLASPSSPVNNKKRKGEVNHESQAAGPLVPPSAQTSPPIAPTETPQKELMFEVPPELPSVQPATASMAIENRADVPPESPQLQPEAPMELQKEPMMCSSVLQAPQSTHITAPSGMESIKEPIRVRVCWTVNIAKTFLDACLHEIAINGRDGGSLKAMSWNKIEEILKDRHNFSVDSNQMKSYFNGLKNKYKAWLSLKNKFGNKYDPSTNKFNLTEKEWETEMKKNKCIESLRKVPLRFPYLCAQLFDGLISTATGLSQTIATSSSAETSLTSATTETPHSEVPEPQKVCNNISLVQVPPDLPQVQPATALEAVETRAEEPVLLAKTGRGGALLGPVVKNMLTCHPPDQTAVGVDQALTGLARHSKKRRCCRPMLSPPHIATVPSGMESIKESKRSRASWEDENVVKTFHNACIHEITINGQEGGSLKAVSWKKVGEILKDRHNFSVDCNQMKSYFNGLKSKYRAWLLLKNKFPNKYDPSNNTFNLTAKEWETEMKKIKSIESLRYSLLRFPDLCAQLFNGVSMGFFRTAATSSPLATTETPHKGESEVTEPLEVCSSLVQIPSKTPQVQPSTAHEAIETKPQEPVVPAKTGPSVDQDLTGLACHSKKRCCPMLLPLHAATGPSGKGMDSIKESKRNRYLWSDDIVKAFLDACIHEIAINGREDGGLKAMSWQKVGEILKDRHNFCIDSKQMKNYFDGLKSKYKAWVSLKDMFGNKYDPSTNTFNLTDNEWETEIKKNKCIEELRLGPLRFPDLCAQLFESFISTRFFQTGMDQASTGPEPGEIIDEPQEALPLVLPSAATEAPAEPQKEPIMCSSLVEVLPELPQVEPASEPMAIETKGSMSVFEEEMLDVLKMIADKINRPQPPSKPTFEDCENKLNELGWPKNDPLYLVALTIFCDKNNHYRELWMKLNPNLCADWVRMIGRSKRLT